MAARNSLELARGPRAIIAVRELHAGTAQELSALADDVATLTA